MRPHYLSTKMKRKVYKNKFSQKRFKFCGCPGIPTTDYDDINQILRINKLRLSTGKGWRVMPKDSCEVYKARRKRHTKRKQRSNEAENDSPTPNKSEKKTIKKPARKTKNKNKVGQRRRHRKRSSSCSCCISRSSRSRSTERKTKY